MKKVLASFAMNTLTKEQMKMVAGGGGLGSQLPWDGEDFGENRSYSCQCNYGPGTWTGNYSSGRKAANAINTYCADGPSGSVQGVCTPV